MAKIIKQRNKQFTSVSNDVIRNDKLSWKARGLFAYLWSMDDDWDFYEMELVKHATDGRDSLRSGLKELEQLGYLYRDRIRNEKGHLMDSNWLMSETPMWNRPMSENPTLSITNNKKDLLKVNTNTCAKTVQTPIFDRKEAFQIFWNEYNKKRSRDKAEKAFNNNCRNQETFNKILKAIPIQRKKLKWDEEKRYQPFASTWLNQRRWEDELEVVDEKGRPTIPNIRTV